MKKRNVRSRGKFGTRKEAARLHTFKNIKTDLAKLRKILRAEKLKALICAVQRDYHYSLVQYLEEYVLTASPSTFEGCKQRYQSFFAKEYAQYKSEMEILIDGNESEEMRYPHRRYEKERRAIRQAAKA